MNVRHPAPATGNVWLWFNLSRLCDRLVSGAGRYWGWHHQLSWLEISPQGLFSQAVGCKPITFSKDGKDYNWFNFIQIQCFLDELLIWWSTRYFSAIKKHNLILKSSFILLKYFRSIFLSPFLFLWFLSWNLPQHVVYAAVVASLR